jgi:hypothetical protein
MRKGFKIALLGLFVLAPITFGLIFLFEFIIRIFFKGLLLTFQNPIETIGIILTVFAITYIYNKIKKRNNV